MASRKKTVRLTVDVTPELYDSITEMAEQLHGSKSEVFRKGIALLQFALEAKAQGKKFGVAEKDQPLATELVGL
ncbi:ribbon-helix-helix protein, CopG family [Synechococcus sp. PCC 7336]|uniref:ribbon-helix-helix protein, CopG family n=1 Tax=Synechococcus sp. PCC 7336 TaxID=195250 RepID=UPI00034AB57C|nr:ribbon-helix-helix protein, CopG family [Synechococcus sp. PCC 7336]